MKTTRYYDDFLLYYNKAGLLQEMNISSPVGRTLGDAPFDDPIMAWIPIYDCVERRYAGFSNALQQAYLGPDNPKQWQIQRFDILPPKTIDTWLWLFLFHRLTGSGASFDQDHGFRNNKVADLMLCHNMNEMVDKALYLFKAGPCFTSIGNQIPPFPKPYGHFNRGCEVYIANYSRSIVREIYGYLMKEPWAMTITDVVDLALAYHRRNGLKAFHFVLTAWVMDIAQYFPNLVDPTSHVYYGKNALESLSLMFEDFTPKSVHSYMDKIMHDTGNREPMSLEDVLCDYVRYIECYVPKGYLKTIEPWQVENRSIANHPIRHLSYYKAKANVQD